MKKILLTGASHGLGRSALDFLIASGVKVVAVARNTIHLQHLSDDKVSIQAVDLSVMNEAQAQALLAGCDTVWHCAALSSPWGKLADFHVINVHATEMLVQAAGKMGIQSFVHISTPSLYFDFTHRQGVKEDEIASQFANHYVATKYLAEQVVLQAAATYTQTRYTMLRPRAIFGAYDRVLIPRLMDLWQQSGGVLKLPKGGEVLMDLTYVDNVVEAMRLASTQIHIPSGSVFNITNQEPWQLKQVLQGLFEGLGQDLRIKNIPYGIAKIAAGVAEDWSNISQKEPKLTRYSIGALSFDMVLDNTKAQQELEYYPQMTMQEGIERTAAAFKQRN